MSERRKKQQSPVLFARNFRRVRQFPGRDQLLIQKSYDDRCCVIAPENFDECERFVVDLRSAGDHSMPMMLMTVEVVVVVVRLVILVVVMR